MNRSTLAIATAIPLAAALALVGCGSPEPRTPGELPPGAQPSLTGNRLVGTAWELIAIELPTQRTPIIVHEPEEYLLVFPDSQTVAIQADCNSCRGRYNTTGRAVALRAECETMGCGPDSKSELYLAMVNTATSFSISSRGEELYVNCAREDGRLTFRRHGRPED